ncbi:5-carboxymethyl-2-hydroxymuconate Delta-isomerase [Ephemeroptericola cinctiostellae]|uniref:5-carboxymethyl-2-hydroxymuconate Delta-isomerase n=1 Tax=Ephemeroptericola cinctiostellae TaxID=2268024 RepID=A0A345DCA0_9BURK|nr:5-carboxymethyl-2-hydroxymuconate Delta-isomerase [Ephemeroptericola cinctiostellae]AXF85988.1 5-carboxymethyl-2-hydroxymuconate Delta-isomerase [Ephemeroptericola cinctiostellae]
MAHLTLEYSANLRDTGEFKQLCHDLAASLLSQKVYPIGGVRVRALPCEDYCVADGSLADAGFVHGTLKIGAGRSDAVKQKTLDDLFSVMKNHFATQFSKQGLALSLELYEFSEAGALKHNNLHTLFKKD